VVGGTSPRQKLEKEEADAGKRRRRARR